MHTDVTHQVITVANEDEARSLANYFNEHGFFAAPEVKEVRVLVERVGDYPMTAMLLRTWRRFWEHSDSGLMGLPMFIKEH